MTRAITYATVGGTIAGTYTLDEIANAIQHVSRPGKNGTVIVKI